MSLNRYVAEALGIPIETMRVYSRGRESEYRSRKSIIRGRLRVCH